MKLLGEKQKKNFLPKIIQIISILIIIILIFSIDIDAMGKKLEEKSSKIKIVKQDNKPEKLLFYNEDGTVKKEVVLKKHERIFIHPKDKSKHIGVLKTRVTEDNSRYEEIYIYNDSGNLINSKVVSYEKIVSPKVKIRQNRDKYLNVTGYDIIFLNNNGKLKKKIICTAGEIPVASPNGKIIAINKNSKNGNKKEIVFYREDGELKKICRVIPLRGIAVNDDGRFVVYGSVVGGDALSFLKTKIVFYDGEGNLMKEYKDVFGGGIVKVINRKYLVYLREGQDSEDIFHLDKIFIELYDCYTGDRVWQKKIPKNSTLRIKGESSINFNEGLIKINIDGTEQKNMFFNLNGEEVKKK